MSETSPAPTPGPGDDLEYDEAHDFASQSPDTPARPGTPVEVATETDDHQGDYSYDLAHEVPRHRP